VILAVTSAILNAWINEQPSLAEVEATRSTEIANPLPGGNLADSSQHRS
jgi:hypothetical protein